MKYRVSGVLLTTGRDTQFVVEGSDPDDVKRQCVGEDVFMRTIELAPDDAPTSTPVEGARSNSTWTEAERWAAGGAALLLVLFAVRGLVTLSDAGPMSGVVGSLMLVAASLCGVVIALIRLGVLVRRGW